MFNDEVQQRRLKAVKGSTVNYIVAIYLSIMLFLGSFS